MPQVLPELPIMALAELAEILLLAAFLLQLMAVKVVMVMPAQ